MAKIKQVALIMGSDSDWNVMKAAADVLEDFKITYDAKVVSAHRTPQEMADFGKTAVEKGYQVVIAGAGGAAHLPGMVAAFSTLPVIGVPVAIGALHGQDALYSIVQMPKGVPVASVAIGNATNAALLAVQILAFGGEVKNEKLVKKLQTYRQEMRKTVKKMKLKK